MQNVIDSYYQEIRVNQEYTSLVYSDFEKSNLRKPSVPIIKVKTLNTNDYLKRINNKNSMEGLYPPNCRYVETSSNGTLVVIEEPPAYRTVKIDMSLSGEIQRLRDAGLLEEYGYTKDVLDKFNKPYTFTLAMPYVVFILYINKVNEINISSVFFRSNQLSGFSDYLCKAPFTNISSDQSICLGDDAHKRGRSLQDTISNVIMVFWSATFNADYTYNYEAYRKTPILNSYIEWQHASKENPMFIYNAEWIKWTRNLKQQINNVKNQLGMTDTHTVNYRELSDIFNKTRDSGIDMKPSEKARKTQRLYYDIAQSIYLKLNLNINVGDYIKMKNGSFAYVDSFVGFMDGGDISYILMKSENGNSFNLKFTPACKKYLIEVITDQRCAQTATLENGNVIKPGDIIIMKRGTNEIYKKVDYIRKSRGEDETILELKIGNHYFLTGNLDAEVFNITSPEISGLKMNKKDIYIHIRDTSNSASAVIRGASRVKYSTINVPDSGNLSAIFKNTYGSLTGYKSSINLEKSNCNTVVLEKDVKELNGIFRLGRMIYNITHDGSAPRKRLAWAHNGRLLYESSFNISKPRKPYIKNLINGNTFFIQGVDFDTTFTIGDKVVVANWATPIDVLNIKEIQGFKVDEERGDIYFILANREGSLSQEKYIDQHNGVISTGRIRRVTNKIEKLKVGTKIIAKKGGVFAFPKKDVNIIVAFIVDGPYEPLVLCSNGCTLWYSTVMEKFTRISMASKKWKSLSHAPLDLSKIKLQAGDIINGQSDYRIKQGYLLYDPIQTRALRALPLECYTNAPNSYSFDKYFMQNALFDCIPNPRIGPKNQTELGSVHGYFDFHGGIIPDPTNKSVFTFINERGENDV